MNIETETAVEHWCWFHGHFHEYILQIEINSSFRCRCVSVYTLIHYVLYNMCVYLFIYFSDRFTIQFVCVYFRWHVFNVHASIVSPILFKEICFVRPHFYVNEPTNTNPIQAHIIMDEWRWIGAASNGHLYINILWAQFPSVEVVISDHITNAPPVIWSSDIHDTHNNVRTVQVSRKCCVTDISFAHERHCIFRHKFSLYFLCLPSYLLHVDGIMLIIFETKIIIFI